TQNHKKLVVLILLGLFIGSLVVTAVFIPLSFFPADERAQFVINVTLPNGWDVSGTEKIVQKLENKLEEMKTVKSKDGKHTLVKDYVAYIGGGGPRFYISIAPQPNQTNTAQFMVVTPNKKVTNETIDTFNVFAKEEVSGALIETIKLETGPSVGAPIQVQIAGTEIETLKQYAHEVEKLMEKNPGVESFSDNFGMDSEKLVINIDQEKAKMLGLTSQDIATGMYVGVEGYPISKLKAPERQIDLVLRVPVSERKNLNNIKSMIFTSSKTGIKHRLDSFAKVSFETQTSEIDRYQQLRTITVSAYIKDNYVSSQVLKELTPQIAKIKMEPGYKVTYGGEQDKSSKAYSDLGVLAIFALFLLLMILSFQFKSLRIGLAIYLAIPLAFIGATAGMWIMRQPLGFMSALGLISLAGVVVNNAIVMIGFIQDNMRQGKDLLVSIKEAGVIRFRPIMLTTLSTLGGLLPLALFGGVLFTPMCWVIIFGLSFSTMLTLLVIPMFFVMFGGARDTERHIKDELEYEQELRNQPSEG
ncbi:MAG: efflux RND transporter permease subunit, partial [Vulcanimicrobiota bacterium]